MRQRRRSLTTGGCGASCASWPTAWTCRERTSADRKNPKAPAAMLPGLYLFLSQFSLPYRLKLCICQYDCVHAESLNPHCHPPAGGLPAHEERYPSPSRF